MIRLIRFLPSLLTLTSSGSSEVASRAGEWEGREELWERGGGERKKNQSISRTMSYSAADFNLLDCCIIRGRRYPSSSRSGGVDAGSMIFRIFLLLMMCLFL